MTEISAQERIEDPHFRAADIALKKAARNAVLAAQKIGEEPVVNNEPDPKYGHESSEKFTQE